MTNLPTDVLFAWAESAMSAFNVHSFSGRNVELSFLLNFGENKILFKSSPELDVTILNEKFLILLPIVDVPWKLICQFPTSPPTSIRPVFSSPRQCKVGVLVCALPPHHQREISLLPNEPVSPER